MRGDRVHCPILSFFYNMTMKSSTTEDQKELLSIDENEKDIVTIPYTNDKYKIGWMCQRTLQLMSRLDLAHGHKEEEEQTLENVDGKSKLMAKAASYAILNGVKIFFFHWFLWRYFFYIKGYTATQLLPIIEMAKKKAPQVDYFLGLILVGQMRITNPTMTTEEAERFRAELGLESNQALEKNTLGL